MNRPVAKTFAQLVPADELAKLSQQERLRQEVNFSSLFLSYFEIY